MKVDVNNKNHLSTNKPYIYIYIYWMFLFSTFEFHIFGIISYIYIYSIHNKDTALFIKKLTVLNLEVIHTDQF